MPTLITIFLWLKVRPALRGRTISRNTRLIYLLLWPPALNRAQKFKAVFHFCLLKATHRQPNKMGAQNNRVECRGNLYFQGFWQASARYGRRRRWKPLKRFLIGSFFFTRLKTGVSERRPASL